MAAVRYASALRLLQLARAHDREQTLDRAFTLFAARPKYDLSPLNCRAKGSLSGIVRGRDAFLVHEGEEVLIVHEERVCQIADVGIGRMEMALAEGEETFLNWQDFRDEFRARQRGPTRARITAKAMPAPKQSAIQRQRLSAEPLRRRGPGEVEPAEQVPSHVCPAELPLADDVFQIGGQAIATEDRGNDAPRNICNTSEPRDVAMR